jgi:peptidoglycan-associated lipoprotein
MNSLPNPPRDLRAWHLLIFAIAVAALLAGCQQEAANGSELGQGPGTGEPTAAKACADITATADRVFFDYDSAELRPDARATLDSMGAQMQQQPQCRFVVEGHCDERGTREYNLALGERRASAVRSYLAALGIDTARLQTMSYGKERPAVTGTGEEVWAKNRRAMLVLNP